MPEDEFLDRNSEWSLMLFLDDQGNWLDASIVINDWDVRINNVDTGEE